MDPVEALTRLGGIGRRKEIVLLAGRREFEQAVGSGRLVRFARGHYALPDAEEAEMVAAQVGGTVSHLSAAMAWGWKVKKPPQEPQLIVPRNSRVSGVKGVRLHYALLHPKAVVDGRTNRLRTAVDCARTLPFDEALAVVDSALRSRQVSRQDLLECARSSPRNGRSRAVRVIQLASPLAANPFESVLRACAMEVPGFEPVAQGRVASVGKADVVDPRLRIALEAESWEHHGIREAFNYDIQRYTAMVRHGWLVLRFIWDDVMHKPDYVRAAIADVVALRVEQQEAGLLVA